MARFRSSYPATIDVKGRIKLPVKHRELLIEDECRELYVCSIFPWELRAYPLPVWEALEERLLSKPAMKPAVLKLIERVSYGQLVDMDDHGRIVIPSLLRDIVEVQGEVVVSGRIDFLAITRRARADQMLKVDTLSHDELEELALLEL